MLAAGGLINPANRKHGNAALTNKKQDNFDLPQEI
jgi:hypothetical protein